MTTNFVFRVLPGHTVGSPEELFERVVALGTELVVKGQLIDFYPLAGSRWKDSSGPAVVVPIQGPEGWHHQHATTLEARGLDCALYP